MQSVDWIRKIKEEFEGKTIYTCEVGGIGGSRLNLNPANLSFCHDAELSNKPMEVDHICTESDFSVSLYYKKVYELLKKFQDAEFGCRSCSKCSSEVFRWSGLSFVTINTSMYCNSKCIYCNAHTLKKDAWNPLPIISDLHEGGAFDKNCFFDWGGGEPTKNPYFAQTVKYLNEHDYLQRINTNAIEFSDETYNALKKGKTILRISADSGTEQGYYSVKGTDNYNAFWNNISRYSKISDEVYLKYNLFNMNSDPDETNAFLSQCKKCGVKKILLDAEISAYQRFINAGPFYFTKKEFDSIHEMEKKAINEGFEVEISGYAFMTRPNIEEKTGKLLLPDNYFDNIDHEVISNNIFIKTFSTKGLFGEYLKGLKFPIVLFGAGEVGYKIKGILDNIGLNYILVDNYRTGWDKVHERDILNAELYFAEHKNDPFCVIMAMRRFREGLKQINEQCSKAEAIWMKESLLIDEDC